MKSIIFVVNEEAADKVQKFWDFNFSMICMEEAAELQQAIAKQKRFQSTETIQNLKEEIRDVMICISGLMKRYGISDGEINEMIASKLKENKDK